MLFFAGILVVSSANLLLEKEEDHDSAQLENNTVLKVANWMCDSTDYYDGEKFFTMVRGRRSTHATRGINRGAHCFFCCFLLRGWLKQGYTLLWFFNHFTPVTSLEGTHLIGIFPMGWGYGYGYGYVNGYDYVHIIVFFNHFTPVMSLGDRHRHFSYGLGLRLRLRLGLG